MWQGISKEEGVARILVDWPFLGDYYRVAGIFREWQLYGKKVNQDGVADPSYIVTNSILEIV